MRQHVSRVDLDLIQNFAKNWLCESIFWGRHHIFKKWPLFDPVPTEYSTKPVKQAIPIQVLLYAIFNHCRTMVVAVLVQKSVTFNLHDNCWLNGHFCHNILKETKVSTKLGKWHQDTSIICSSIYVDNS